MDTITQGMLGVAVVECGFRQRGGRAAFWMGVAGAVLPDLDMMVGLAGRALGNPWLGWQYHRHFTHSVFFAPLAGLGLAWIWSRRAGSGDFRFWYLCSVLVLLTHTLLDWCTSYGTMLLSPFSSRRFALDIVAIIDPFYSVGLLATILLCRRRRRKKPHTPTWPIGLAGVLLTTAYLGCGYVQHGTAMGWLRARAAEAGHHVRHARAMPTLGNIFVWRLVYRTDEAFHFGRANTVFDRQARDFRDVLIPDSAAIRAARLDPRVRTLAWFADGMVLPEESGSAGRRAVRFRDVRYSRTTNGSDGLWGIMVLLNDDGTVMDVRPYHRRMTPAMEDRPGRAADHVPRPAADAAATADASFSR